MTITTFAIDKAHTDVVVAIKHMMVTTVRGKFGGVDGTLNLDLEHPSASSGSFTIDAASLNTGVEQRDGHLRSPDFLDTATYPVITFVSTRVEAKGGTDFAVTGDLTVRDVTRPITLDVEYLGSFRSMAGADRAGFHAIGKINREEFGLTWNVGLETGGWLVGKEIRLEIDLAVEAVTAAVEGGVASAA